MAISCFQVHHILPVELFNSELQEKLNNPNHG